MGACIICPTGQHQNTTGEPFCYDCVVGKSGPSPGLLECVECGNGKYQDEIGEADCKELDQCTQTMISSSEAGVLDANPCAQLGDTDAVCIDALAPQTGNNCTCSDERAWESLYTNVDPGVGEAVCNQRSLLVPSSMSIGGSITQDNFVLGMTEAITAQIESDPGFEEAQAAALENTLVPVDPEAPPVEVRVTRYEITVTSAVHGLPCCRPDYSPGDPSSGQEPLAKYTSLVNGLTAAACGDLSSDMCSVSDVDFARRRRVQDADASPVSVSFVVTASVDIYDNVEPDIFSAALVSALANEPNGALSDVDAADVSIDQPEIVTDIVYIVVASDTAVSTSAARTMLNEAAVQKSLNKYTDSPITVDVNCPTCDEIIESNTATPMIVYVIVFFVLLAVMWAVGILVYGRQTGAATMLEKVEAVAEAVANPMFEVAEAAGDVIEAAADVSTTVVKETVDATAVEAVKKTGKAAKKGGKKAVAVANPMYDDDE